MFDIIRNINNLNDRNTPILQKSYNEFQNELIRLDTHNSLVGSVNQLREDRIAKNRVNIDSIDADLMTTRRQVEIIQNRNLIKEDIIYILRALFVFTAITIISYVYLAGTEYRQPAMIVIGVAAIYYFGGKALSFLSRSANRWTLQNWSGTKYKVETPIEAEVDVCAAENAKYDAEMAKIKGKMLDKLIAMRERFNKLDSNKKRVLNKGEEMRKDYAEILRKTDLIFDKLPKDKQNIIIEAKKKEIAKRPIVPTNEPTPSPQPLPSVQPTPPPPPSSSSNNKSESELFNDAMKNNMEKMIRDSLIDMLSSAPYPLSLLNNDKDTHINAILAFYKKDPNTDPQVFKNYFWQQLKQKGISDADINKAFIEMDKKDDEMRKKRKEDGIEFQL
jgi:hypothetical protein